MTKAAVDIAREAGIRLIINDRHCVSGGSGRRASAKMTWLSVSKVLLGPDAIIGLSTHNLQQAEKLGTYQSVT